jgi:hypothetical protein
MVEWNRRLDDFDRKGWRNASPLARNEVAIRAKSSTTWPY